jgi:uncharacterized OB-fold protein
MSEPPAPPFRVLPAVDDATRPFWTGGEHGELRILRCRACGTWLHPPGPVCPVCLGTDLAPEATSGRAVVHTYTVNHQPWYPGLDPPYVVAIVALPEQEALRLTTNIVGCAPGDVRIGLPVRVTFDRYDDVWLPMFEPDPDVATLPGDDRP